MFKNTDLLCSIYSIHTCCFDCAQNVIKFVLMKYANEANHKSPMRNDAVSPMHVGDAVLCCTMHACLMLCLSDAATFQFGGSINRHTILFCFMTS